MTDEPPHAACDPYATPDDPEYCASCTVHEEPQPSTYEGITMTDEIENDDVYEEYMEFNRERAAKLPSRTYYAVPGDYFIGDVFDTFEEAYVAAKSRVVEFPDLPGHYTRAFVDTRVSDKTGDHVVERVEVLFGGTTVPA